MLVKEHEDITPGSGIFLSTRKNSSGQWHILLAGETSCLAAWRESECMQDAAYQASKAQGATDIAILPWDCGETGRRFIVHDIVVCRAPPCNFMDCNLAWDRDRHAARPRAS